MSVAQIAKAIGWSTKATRRVLKEAGAVTKIGDRWYATQGRLLTAMPEILEALQAHELAAEEDDEWEP